MTPTGFEQPAKSPAESAAAESGGAESGALGTEFDQALAEVVRKWPALPADVRSTIFRMIRFHFEDRTKKER